MTDTPTAAQAGRSLVNPGEAIIRLTTTDEGESGCVVAATSARLIAESIASGAPDDPTILVIDIVSAAGTVETVYTAGGAR